MKYNGRKLGQGARHIIRVATFAAFNKHSKNGFQRSGKYALGRLTSSQHKVFASIKKQIAHIKIRKG